MNQPSLALLQQTQRHRRRGHLSGARSRRPRWPAGWQNFGGDWKFGCCHGKALDTAHSTWGPGWLLPLQAPAPRTGCVLSQPATPPFFSALTATTCTELTFLCPPWARCQGGHRPQPLLSPSPCCLWPACQEGPGPCFWHLQLVCGGLVFYFMCGTGARLVLASAVWRQVRQATSLFFHVPSVLEVVCASVE